MSALFKAKKILNKHNDIYLVCGSIAMQITRWQKYKTPC